MSWRDEDSLNSAHLEISRMEREIERLERELRDTRAALVMIRGVVAGVLEDERPVGGEFA